MAQSRRIVYVSPLSEELALQVSRHPKDVMAASDDALYQQVQVPPAVRPAHLVRRLPPSIHRSDYGAYNFAPTCRKTWLSSPLSVPAVSVRSPLATSPAAKKRTDMILCMGDSLTSGRRNSTSYPSELQTLLDQEGVDVKVRNGGNWGDTSDQILRRLQPLLQSILSSGGRVLCVLVLAGTNDILQATHADAVPRIAAKVAQICAVASQAAFHPHVGILTLPPLLSRDSLRLKLNHQLLQLAETDKSNVPGLPGEGRRFLVDLGTLDPLLSTDGVHFSEEGYVEFARRVFDTLLPVLKTEMAARAAIVT
mmetsp:Transcript_17532/g.32984  ORF Transcript_17532/g.32984 Transcript_17532/m.32984 type:complete len:309 (-) Transcript_17532:125-1051(-)